MSNILITFQRENHLSGCIQSETFINTGGRGTLTFFSTDCFFWGIYIFTFQRGYRYIPRMYRVTNSTSMYCMSFGAVPFRERVSKIQSDHMSDSARDHFIAKDNICGQTLLACPRAEARS